MKTSAIIRIVICVLLLALLIGVAVFAVRWWNGDMNWNWGNINMGGYTYKNSGDYDVGARDIDPAGIRNLEINWISGEIHVVYGDDSKISLEENTGLKEEDQLRSLVRGDTLIIQFCAPRAGVYKMEANKDLTVTLPRDLALNRLTIDAVSADGRVEGVRAKDCGINNVSGNYVLTDCSFERLDVDGVSGDCSFSGEARYLDVDTVSGDMEAKLTTMAEKITLDSVSGDLTLYIPEGAGFRAEIDGVSGDLDCDFPVTRRDGEYICGDGSCEIEVDGVSGDLRIRALNEN